MRTDVRRQLEAMIRALEFSRAYRPDEPGVQGVIVWIQECVARAEVLIRQLGRQREGPGTLKCADVVVSEATTREFPGKDGIDFAQGIEITAN
jgi:hypothetical protein